MSIYPPYVIERTSRGERSYDIFSRLLMDRIVFLGTGIDDNVANIIVAQLLFLDAEDPERDIFMYINSPGRQRVRRAWRSTTPCSTCARPCPRSAWAWPPPWARSCWRPATTGKRNALPNSRIMIHQPSGGSQGTAADIEIAASEILYVREKPQRDPGEAHGPDASSGSRTTWIGTVS